MNMLLHQPPRNKIGITLLMLLGVVFSGTGVLSSRAASFTSSFKPIRFFAKPGQTITSKYTLGLESAERRLHFRAKVEDWWRSIDGKQTIYRKAGTVARSCAHWVTLDPVEQAVDPGSKIDIRVTVRIPKETKPGGYWCALTVDELQDPTHLAKKRGVGVSFVASFSTAIYILIRPLDLKAKILEVKLESAKGLVTVQNQGNTPLIIQGRLEFVPPGDTKPLATAKLKGGVVLPIPINKRIMVAPLPSTKELPTGRYMVKVIIDIGLDHFIGVQKEMKIWREAKKPPKKR